MAHWARRPIDLGGGNTFTALVLGRAGVPVVDDAERARVDPELAVLSAMAHGRDRDPQRGLRVALGKAEGEAKGKAEGKAELLLRQLTRRFGRIPAAVRTRVVAASPETLDRWAERFVDATSLNQVFTED